MLLHCPRQYPLLPRSPRPHTVASPRCSATALDLLAAAPPAIHPWYFLQDNAPIHKTQKVMEFFHNNGVSVIDFPPYSPDLNPIENLWAILAREVEKTQCSDEDALGDAVLDAWNNVAPEVFRNLARSMPKRCAAVVEARGQHTAY